MSLAAVFEKAATGTLPAPDGQVELLNEDAGKAFAVVAFPSCRAARRGGESLGLRPVSGEGYQRVQRAHRYRDDVRAWQTGDGAGCLTLGRGLAGRWEVSFEVEPPARGRGLGRALAAAALGLLPPGTPVFAQVAPGNSVSLRATLAAGYVPVGAEVLLPRHAVAGAS